MGWVLASPWSRWEAQRSRRRPWETFGFRLRAVLYLAWWYAGREEAKEGRDDAHA